MPVVHAPETAYAQEMRKWEAHHGPYGAPGRPFQYREYPTRMYRAKRPKAGGPPEFDSQEAKDEREREAWERQGFVYGGQQMALDALERQEREYAELAAERNFEVRRMSDKARAEVAAVEAEAGAQHLPTIPEAPKKRGRPRKTDIS